MSRRNPLCVEMADLYAQCSPSPYKLPLPFFVNYFSFWSSRRRITPLNSPCFPSCNKNKLLQIKVSAVFIFSFSILTSLVMFLGSLLTNLCKFSCSMWLIVSNALEKSIKSEDAYVPVSGFSLT